MQMSKNSIRLAKLIRIYSYLYDKLFKSSLPLSSLHLKSIKKHTTNNGNASTRIKSVEDTLAEIIPLCKNIGVTRISDITYMDKLYIPNYTAILPGTEDSIWVYSGKGPTKAACQSKCFNGINRTILFSYPVPIPKVLFKELIWSYQNHTIKYCILMK